MSTIHYAAGEGETRPWGTWTVIDVGENFIVKRIVVNPGGRLSLQYHHHRSESWVVASGMAKVTIGESVTHLPAHGTAHIPVKAVHRLENPGPEPLVIIEIQLGDRLDEGDIVRLEDDYERG